MLKDTTDKIEKTKKKAEDNMKKTVKEYKSFAMKGNIIDLAIGVVIGSAFTNIVNTLVSSTITPIISLLTNKVDLSTLYVSLDGKKYESLAKAKEVGAIVWEYGALFNTLVNFFVVSFTLFIIVKNLDIIRKKSEHKEEEIKKVTTKDCMYCKSKIPIEATKCAFCTSDVVGKKKVERKVRTSDKDERSNN